MLPQSQRLAAAKVWGVLPDALHVLRERAWRIPNPLLHWQLERTTPPDLAPLVWSLRRDGVAVLPNHVSGERLAAAQRAFNRMIAFIEAGEPGLERPVPAGWRSFAGTYREHGVAADIETTFSYEPFRASVELLDLALDPTVCALVARYFGRRFMMHQAIAARYHPTARNGFASWQWHHDGWGKRINAMVLLTDVGPADQYMSFMKRAHKLVHPRSRYANSRFTEEEVMAVPGIEKVDCLGSAGTVFVFDPNAFHRGNRSLGSHRDSLITSYSCGRYIWPFDVPKSSLRSLSEEQRAVLARNPRIRYLD